MNLKAYAAISEQGPYLQVNEDTFEIDLNKNLYMIFDGFGGAGVGDRVASDLKSQIKDFYQKVSLDPDSTLPFFFSPSYLLEGNALINAMLYAHAELFKANEKVKISKRGGASSIIAACSQSILTLASIGNCCAYLVRKGRIIKIFIPDDFLLISTDDFDKHLKSMPMNAFGLFSDLRYQIKEVKIEDGDKVVLLSDGAYSRLEESQVLFAVNEESKDLKEKINTLFKLSNTRGNLDNQTAMILEF
jgi:PPM family protein phosphatase